MDKSTIQDVLGQYKPDTFDFNPMTGTVDLSFRKEASISLAHKTLNGRMLFGRKLTATRLSASEVQLPTAPFAFPVAPPAFFQFPPYNEQIGAHILHYAAIRQDFYNSVLMLMKSMGLPPPFASSNGNEASNSNNGHSSAPLDDIPPGSRIKRNQPDLHSPELLTEYDTLNGYNLPSGTKKPVGPDHSSSELTAEEPEQIETPIQPLHLDLSRPHKGKSSEKSILNIIIAEKPHESTCQPRKDDNIEIVPFDAHAQAGSREVGPLVKNFISEAELNANRITMEQIKAIPRFQDWEPGLPSSKLFVKNLAPKLAEFDLARIFGRFSRTGLGDDVSVRLMTRGKMHGQAFVTFPDVEMAQKALDQVLGFLLHDRPIILVFGKQSDNT
jgi:U11/U12 small nuclear ribonucleoprotein SNRNP65